MTTVEESRPHLAHTGNFVTVLRNVYTEDECQELIELSEQKGYEPATITKFDGSQIMDTSHRDSDRTMLDDPARAAELFRRIRSYIPDPMDGCKLVGINERLRFLRYDKGQKFSPHQDGCYIRPDGSEESFLTMQLYLNGGPGQLEGGETVFLDDDMQVQFKLEPRAGTVLIFDHDCLHAGSPVVSGRKYCIRSDVMYETDE